MSNEADRRSVLRTVRNLAAAGSIAFLVVACIDQNATSSASATPRPEILLYQKPKSTLNVTTCNTEKLLLLLPILFPDLYMMVYTAYLPVQEGYIRF